MKSKENIGHEREEECERQERNEYGRQENKRTGKNYEIKGREEGEKTE
jgi:hypothetical protein